MRACVQVCACVCVCVKVVFPEMAGCGLPDSMTKLLSSFSVFSLLSMYFCIDKQGVSVLVCVCVCVSGRAMKISSSLLLSPLSKRSFRIWFIDAAYVFVFA